MNASSPAFALVRSLASANDDDYIIYLEIFDRKKSFPKMQFRIFAYFEAASFYQARLQFNWNCIWKLCSGHKPNFYAVRNQHCVCLDLNHLLAVLQNKPASEVYKRTGLLVSLRFQMWRTTHVIFRITFFMFHVENSY